jgi:hypothetical protein
MPFPIELKYISEAEAEMGIEFPDKFKAKMILENGGEVLTDEDEWQLFPFFDKLDSKRISRTCNHIGLETEQAKEWGNFPVDAVAIGSNGFGDYLILLPSSINFKKLGEDIYLWFHETGELTKYADSINDLMK